MPTEARPATRALRASAEDLDALRAWLAERGDHRSAAELAWAHLHNPVGRPYAELATSRGGDGHEVVTAAAVSVPAWTRLEGDRRFACRLSAWPGGGTKATSGDGGRGAGLGLEEALVERCSRRAAEEGAALAYGVVDAVPDALRRSGFDVLGRAPALTRPLSLAYLAASTPALRGAFGALSRTRLVLPRRGASDGVRAIDAVDPRLTRLWDRFSIDVGAAVERDARFMRWRVFERPGAAYRAILVEDGDRYAIRAFCVFTVRDEPAGRTGYVLELLHDRSVAGMRGASRLLGAALREMSDAGAIVARAWSLASSGSYPIFLRHAFFPSRDTRRTFAVRALDPAAAASILERQRWYLSYLDSDDV